MACRPYGVAVGHQMLSDPAWANTTLDPKYGAYSNNDGINPTCQLSAYRGGLKCCGGVGTGNWSHFALILYWKWPFVDNVLEWQGTLLMDGEENRSKLIADADYDHYQAMYRVYYQDGE